MPDVRLARRVSLDAGALELRRLQTLTEIGVEHNSTIIAMLPVELRHVAQKIAERSALEAERARVDAANWWLADRRLCRNDPKSRNAPGRAMAVEAVEKQFDALMLALTATLKPLGYTKQEQRFRHTIGGNVALIEVQRSLSSNRAAIRLTINICVVSSRLAGTDSDVKNLGGSSAQLRQRIGFFLSDPQDKWWDLTGMRSDAKATDEIVDILNDKVLPFLNAHATDQGLADLWETGRSPGITEVQRVRFLAALRSVA